MTEKEYQELNNDELLRRLDNSDLMDRFLRSEDWKLFNEAFRRIYEDADARLNEIDPGDYKKIAELQIMKKFYKNVLQTTIQWYKVDGEAAWSEAKDRGLLEQLKSLVIRTK